ncbi:UNVERIFIED_CONTAM: hypothetical protein GTU68_064628 [Idotea baltica]|nr:hypothetical protein [Idotea baltica]
MPNGPMSSWLSRTTKAMATWPFPATQSSRRPRSTSFAAKGRC